MTFLQPFELLWEAITIPDEEKLQLESYIYDFKHGNFNTDDDGVLKSETKVNLVDKDGTSGPEFCKFMNDKTVERIRDDYNTVLENLNRLPENSKYRKQKFFLEGVISGFDYWYQTHDYESLILTSSGENFRHFKDYSTVWLNDSEYQLTVNQSKVVKVLHGAHIDKKNWLGSARIFDGARIQADKMSDVFKNHKEIMHALIEYNRSRQQYRLKL